MALQLQKKRKKLEKQNQTPNNLLWILKEIILLWFQGAVSSFLAIYLGISEEKGVWQSFSLSTKPNETAQSGVLSF